MCKKCCSLALAFLLVFSTLTNINAQAIAPSDSVQSRLEVISGQSGYKPGAQKQANFCWYFVNYVSQNLFGVSIPNKPNGYQLKGIAENANWVLVDTVSGSSATNSAVKNVLKQAVAGDIIQYKNRATSQHTAMIYATNNSGISIYESTKVYKGAKTQQVRIYTCTWENILSWSWEKGLGSFDGVAGYGLSLYRCNKNTEKIDNPPVQEENTSKTWQDDVYADVTTTTADTITETGAILRGSFTTTGDRATECGMYLGTSENNLTWLGSDTVNTYGTSMFYSTAKYGRTLEPGTTYYYQAYAVAGGKEYRGTVKNFRTEGIQPSISITTRSFCIKDDREPIQLTANTEPYGASVTWSSSDNSVVYVYENTGKIVGVAPGTATITAEMEYNGRNYYASCDVTVLPREVNPDITLNAENVNIEEKTYTLLVATTTPNGETVKWESSDSSVATVDDAGFVSGVSAGTATISASFEYNGHTYTAYCAVTVEPVQDNSLKVSVLSLSSSQIKEGESFTAYWTEAAADASYYIDYSGRTAGGSSEFGMSGSTKSLSMSTGSFWSAGTYTLCIVASNSTGSVRSNEVELIIQEKDNTKSGIVVNTNGQYLAINDRAAASPKYSNQIGRIPPAGVVTVYPDKASGNWYYVEYNGVSGYAYGKYISLQ